MLIPNWLTQALEPRLITLLNHIVATEPVALARLQAHVGRRLQFDCTGPAGKPVLPSLNCVITPAGLMEAVSAGSAGVLADLRIVLDASQPVHMFFGVAQGLPPKIDVTGDAALASEISWLFEHLRWDIEDDLAPWLGPVWASELVRFSGYLMLVARETAKRLSALSARSGAGFGPSA